MAFITSSITTLSLILGTAFMIDGRYAHADSVQKTELQTSEFIRQQTAELKVQTQLLRRSIIEDKLFELDTKRNPVTRSLQPVDEAQYQRYNRQLNEIDGQIRVIKAGSQSAMVSQ